ncbi:MAG: hypothetical protein IPP56_01785 [Bacteroidetes bacterium]|nr:hypothetical protein [Bacteroidota bacterium]
MAHNPIPFCVREVINIPGAVLELAMAISRPLDVTTIFVNPVRYVGSIRAAGAGAK